MLRALDKPITDGIMIAIQDAVQQASSEYLRLKVEEYVVLDHIANSLWYEIWKPLYDKYYHEEC